MRVFGWLLGVLLVVGLVVGGVLVYRSTAPGDTESDYLFEDDENLGLDDATFVEDAFDDDRVLFDDEESAFAEDVSPLPSASVGSGRVVISIADTGFNPVAVTVTPGTTVVFVNNGQGLHWPASDVHPTHQELPGFDAGRRLSTGEEYSFVFSDSGTWSFHDHVNPQFTGSVTVAE